MWVVETLRTVEEGEFPVWVPVDPERPTYDSYAEAAHAHDDYRNSHPRARIRMERRRFAPGEE